MLFVSSWAVAEPPVETVAPVTETAATVTGPAVLHEYLAKADESFAWSIRRRGKYDDISFVELSVTSQTWQGIAWRHQLFLLIPEGIAPDIHRALFVIEGGSWKPSLAEPPKEGEDLPGEAPIFAALAREAKTPVAIMLQVPFQPMFEGRREDALIALTFQKFLQTGKRDWPLLLPMVKAAQRGMDATQEVLKQEFDRKIDTFTVTGASKRGWTTWLTGANDPRANVICPMVIDMLNIRPQMVHQVEAWGDYSEQIDDYTELQLQQKLASPEGEKLRTVIDPYEYRADLGQEKLIVLATNDAYWPLDALNLYWDGLTGPKRILYVPNNGHGITDFPRVFGSVVAMHYAANGDAKLPRLTWSFTDGKTPCFASGETTSASEATTPKPQEPPTDRPVKTSATEEAVAKQGVGVTLSSDITPRRVRVWSTTSPTQDFRPARWSSEDVEAGADGSFTLHQEPDGTKYRAFFLEAEYPGGAYPMRFCTNLRIVPPTTLPTKPAPK